MASAPQKLLEGMDQWEVRAEELELQEKLGEGAHSLVFAGRWRGRRVAVKTLRVCFKALGCKEHEALCRELSILCSLSHPNIVKFFGVVPYQPIPILMELCSGGCCFELLHESAVELAWQQKLKMCRDVCEAMCYLHGFDPPVIHRDLKSLNVLLASVVASPSDEVTLKLADFGQSRLKRASETAAFMTKAVGTSHWMAPEVRFSDVYDEKVDVYSFGMFIFEVVCRKVPFEDYDDPQYLNKVVREGERPSWDVRPADCPDMLVSLGRLCWAQDPNARPDFPSVLKFLGMVQVPQVPQAPQAPPQAPAAPEPGPCGAACLERPPVSRGPIVLTL